MSQKQNPLVLVADDEPSMLALVSDFVRSKGYTVIEASDGDMAWQLAHERLPDLVILDVMMPGMSGWEVCRKIREAVSLAHTGVIMLTGIGENLNEMTSPLYGADTYIDKPFEFAALQRGITETLKKRKKGVLGRADGADQVSDVELDEIPPSKAPESAPVTKQRSKKVAAKQGVTSPKKAAAKKAKVAKKVVAKKAAPQKATAKKVVKKAAAKKAATKKAGKQAPAKATKKKAVSKKSASKKAPTKKPLAKKATKATKAQTVKAPPRAKKSNRGKAKKK